MTAGGLVPKCRWPPAWSGRRRLRLNDLRAAVEKDVRQALDNLATREDQVQAAQKVVGLAERELELAQDRFENGVADNMEVTNAQTVLENARQVLVSSLAQFNVARLNLASALGHVRGFPVIVQEVNTAP